MKFVLGALVLTLLAGCSSPSDLMAGKPEMTISSSKSPKALALCVFPAWQDHSSTSTMTETGSGYRLVNGYGQQTDDVLEIATTQSGSSAKLYQRAAWSQIGRGSLKDSLYGCR